MEIGVWLRGLGLEQYEPAFRDNDIDAEVLPELTANDLIEHRRDLGRPSPQAPCRHCRVRHKGAAGRTPRCTGTTRG